MSAFGVEGDIRERSGTVDAIGAIQPVELTDFCTERRILRLLGTISRREVHPERIGQLQLAHKLGLIAK